MTRTTLLAMCVGLCMLVPAGAVAGPDTLWTRVYDPNGPSGHGLPIRLVTDSSGYYVYGAYSTPNVELVTAKYTNTAEFAWARHYSRTTQTSHVDLASFPGGGVVALGKVLNSGGNFPRYEVELMRYRPDGTPEWENSFREDSFSLWPLAAVVDRSGNTLVTGSYSERFGNDDVLLLKVGPNGVRQWLVNVGDTSALRDEAGWALAVNSLGQCYVAGDAEVMLNGRVRHLTRLTMFGTGGDTLWSRCYIGPDTAVSRAVAVAVGPNGDVVVLLTDDFGSGDPYPVVCCYSATGSERWVQEWHSPDQRPASAVAIALDSSGCVYAACNVSLGPTGKDVAVLKYTSEGELEWTGWYAGARTDDAQALALDQDNSCYVTGSSVDSLGNTNVMMVRFAADGAFLWQHRLGWGIGRDVAVSPGGLVLAAAELRPTPNPPPDVGLIAYTETSEPHDVGCTRIVAPAGRIDSGTVVTPVCSLFNYGTTAESYPVRMRVGTGYEQAAQVTNHPPLTALEVRFPDWQVGPTGRHAVTCSTECADDPHPENDARRTTVEVNPPGVGEAGPAPALGREHLRASPRGSTAHIEFSTGRPSAVRVSVMDAAGRVVRVLVASSLPPGTHSVTWDGRDAANRRVAAGVYVVCLSAGVTRLTERVTLVR